MFDPYHKWLGIPKHQRPPTLYQLLGISPDEDDAEVIEEASLMRIAHVRNYQLGPHAEECSRLLHELGEAGATLCSPERRAAYDAELAAKAAPTSPSAVPPSFSESSNEVIVEAVGKRSAPVTDSATRRADARWWEQDDSRRASSHNLSARYGPDPLDDTPDDASLVKTAPPFHDAETPVPQTWDRTPADETPYIPATHRGEAPPPTKTGPETMSPKSSGRAENEFLQKLSDKALMELREPIHIEDESWWGLLVQMFREWCETLKGWGIKLPPGASTYLRRACTLAVLAAVVWLVVAMARRLS